MLAALLFIAFWVVLGLGLLFVSLRGGPRGARDTLQSQTYQGRRAATAIFTVFYLVLGVLVPVLILTGDHAKANDSIGGVTLTAGEKHGREIFGLTCGVCHTLKAADAQGTVGPNLDMLQPSKALVLNAIQQGRQNGNGTMPAGLVPNAEDQQDVANFVSMVAGR